MAPAAVYQVIVSGIATGCVYAILAVSLIIIYKSTEVVNFASGEVLIFGAYLGMLALIYFGMPYPAAFGFGALAMFAIGSVFEIVVLLTVSGRRRYGSMLL